MESLHRSGLKRSRPSNDDYEGIDKISKPTRRVLTREEFYGLEKDFFGNLVQKNRLKIGTEKWNFDREKVLQDYKRQLAEAKSVEDHYAREKNILREAFAFRERRRMIPENK